eukprot:TRINITY_DN6029_c0_g1_i1.p2 TRINITY_DN6029_c0_g1~~TRINITY_DN6029_c0_g1_i1.p2  ORF type:complete len:637 (-),score=120.96 TRINITY_DN6029_c0_g1_i1:22-1932(-)
MVTNINSVVNHECYVDCLSIKEAQFLLKNSKRHSYLIGLCPIKYRNFVIYCKDSNSNIKTSGISHNLNGWTLFDMNHSVDTKKEDKKAESFDTLNELIKSIVTSTKKSSSTNTSTNIVQIVKSSYFHPTLSLNDSHELLLSEHPGTYMFHYGDFDRYIFCSYRTLSSVNHIPLYISRDGDFTIENETFSSLESLVNRFRHVCLLYPIMKPDNILSLYNHILPKHVSHYESYKNCQSLTVSGGPHNQQSETMEENPKQTVKRKSSKSGLSSEIVKQSPRSKLTSSTSSSSINKKSPSPKDEKYKIDLPKPFILQSKSKEEDQISTETTTNTDQSDTLNLSSPGKLDHLFIQITSSTPVRKASKAVLIGQTTPRNSGGSGSGNSSLSGSGVKSNDSLPRNALGLLRRKEKVKTDEEEEDKIQIDSPSKKQRSMNSKTNKDSSNKKKRISLNTLILLSLFAKDLRGRTIDWDKERESKYISKDTHNGSTNSSSHMATSSSNKSKDRDSPVPSPSRITRQTISDSDEDLNNKIQSDEPLNEEATADSSAPLSLSKETSEEEKKKSKKFIPRLISRKSARSPNKPLYNNPSPSQTTNISNQNTTVSPRDEERQEYAKYFQKEIEGQFVLVNLCRLVSTTNK